MEDQGTPNPATDFINSFKQMVGDREFESMEELQQTMDAFRIASNNAANLDFLGLSPSQMRSIRHNSVEDIPDIVKLRFPLDAVEYKHTPAVAIAVNIMLSIVIEGPWKATDKGNLPLRMVRNINQINGDVFLRPHDNPRSEQDLPDLWVIRNLLEMARLIERDGRTFMLTDLGIEMLEMLREDQTVSRLYRLLLLTYTNRFNWLVGTTVEDEFSDIQYTAPFCLYLLHKKARNFTSEEVLADIYARAFPQTGQMLVDRIPELRGKSVAQDYVADRFQELFLYNYCWLFGLLEPKDDASPDRPQGFRTTKVFETTFDWQV